MADCLKRAGYATAAIGKWHLGATRPYLPRRRGFDEFFGSLHEGHFFAPPPYRGMMTRLRVNEPPYDDANPISAARRRSRNLNISRVPSRARR
jgi:arylsulfatase A-like enzyme